MEQKAESRASVGASRVSASVRAAVREAMGLADWAAHVPLGSRVALKPNLCWDLPLPGAQTSPWVLDAVIEVIKERTSDIIVVEAGQVTVDADVALHRCGLDRILEKHNVPFVNMSRGEFYTVSSPDSVVLCHVELPMPLQGRVLVTLPVLKTHMTTTMTGALKNQWGCLRELRHNHHLVVDDAISDINALLTPAFAVMDATVGLEGNGPKTGHPRVADLVLASADLVALDSTAARVMGFDPAHIPHLRIAAARGLGETESSAIDVLGEDLREVNLAFCPPSRGLIPRTEFALRRSRLRRLAFETRALSLLAFAARVYNAAWYAGVGRMERRRIVRETRYGAQWLGHDEPDVNRGDNA